MKLFIGIDIGKQGAIASLSESNVLKYYPIPLVGNQVSKIGIRKILEEIFLESGTDNKEILVGLEDVHSIFGASAKSNFQFGRCLGLIEGIVDTKELPSVLVQPKTWQKFAFLGVPEIRKPDKVSETGKILKGTLDTKAMALIAVQRLFPSETFLATSRSKVPHDGIVDAALIAYYLKNHR